LKDKENRTLVDRVVKAMVKREKNELPVRIEGSSELSQTAIVQVDLTGMKPTISEGGNAERDMPVRKRRARSWNLTRLKMLKRKMFKKRCLKKMKKNQRVKSLSKVINQWCYLKDF
jgi:hypothetical protein